MTHTTLHVTGPGLLELGERQKRGEVTMLGMEVGQAVIVGRDKNGKARTRRDPAGWTVSLRYESQPPAPALEPEPETCGALCVEDRIASHASRFQFWFEKEGK